MKLARLLLVIAGGAVFVVICALGAALAAVGAVVRVASEVIDG